MSINNYLKSHGLNAQTKRHRVAEYMDKKRRPIYMLPPRHPPQIKRHTQTKTKGMENDIHTIGKDKKAGVAMLISDKIDFKTKAKVRDKDTT